MNKYLVQGLMAASLVASVALSALPARAEFTKRDVLIKGQSSSSVYYLANNGRRYVFPNDKTYFTWFQNFAGVSVISDSDLIAFPLGGNVTYRPGIRLVKITTDPKVYAVDREGTLRWIANESTAIKIYGSDWAKKVDDVPDAFFVNYRSGSDIRTQADFKPRAVSNSAKTINVEKSLTVNGTTKTADTTVNAPADYTGSSSSSNDNNNNSNDDDDDCDADVWECSNWGSCSSTGKQTRTCTMTTNCSGVSSSTPVKSRSCDAVSEGTVTVTDDTEDGIVLEDTDAVLAEFRLTAKNEDMRLEKATFSVEDPVAVQSLRLYDEDDDALTSSVTVTGNGDAKFTNVDYVIPKNSTKIIQVRGRINNVGNTGAPSGSNAKITFRNTSGSSRQFEIRGESSDVVITTLPGGDKVGNDKIVRKTAIAVQEVSLPSRTIAAGDMVLSRIKFTADQAGEASIKGYTVEIQKSSSLVLALTGDTKSTIRVMNGSSNIDGHSTATGCGSGSTKCTVRTRFTSAVEISEGSSKTLDLRMTVSGTTNNSDVSTHLLADTTIDTGEVTSSGNDQLKVDGSNANFVWSDHSDSPHSDEIGNSSEDWASGVYLIGLPTDNQSADR